MVVLGLLLLPAASAQQPPADTGVLDVTLPPGAEVSINGTNYGAERHFEMRPLEKRWLYPYDIVARFRGGETVQRKVLLKGGWSVRPSLSPPDPSRPELVLQTGHSSTVHSVAVSPDGRYILTGSYDKTVILWDAATGQQIRSFQGHGGPVYSVAISTDGRQVLTGINNKTAMLWDAATDQQIRVFQGHNSDVRSLALSPDFRQVLTGSGDGTAILWDAVTGEQIRSFQGHRGSVECVGFSGGRYRDPLGRGDR
jgi:WD40 repeat protein